jgi:pimeloyl-ACP methyl ester carboxylesterase
MSAFSDHVAGGFGWRERPGPGPVLLALHGIGSQPSAFDALAGHLDGWHLIAWETPGYGASNPLVLDWPQAGDYAQALADFTARRGLRRFHLVGHSLGTLIGAAFALAHPDRVQGLVLVSCAQGGGVGPGANLPPAQAARLDDLAREGAAEFARKRAPRLVFQPEQNPDLVAAVTNGMARVKLPGYAQAVRMLASGDLARDCADLQVPTAIVVGAKDIITPPDQSCRAHAALPAPCRGVLVQVPGAGHALPQQAPAALANVIKTHARESCAQQETRT